MRRSNKGSVGMRQPRLLTIRSNQMPCPHQQHQQRPLARVSAAAPATCKRNNRSSNVIRASEYRNLRQVVPSLRRQRDLGKVEVVTEAAKYIDYLHKTLIKRFVACGIPESLKDILGTDNANELNSQHIMNLVTQMAAKQRAGQQQQQQQQQLLQRTAADSSAILSQTSAAVRAQPTGSLQQVTNATSSQVDRTRAPNQTTTTQSSLRLRGLPVPASKRCAADEPGYFGSAHK